MAAMSQDAHAVGPVPRSLFVTNDFPPRVGGAQTYYWNMIQTLDPGDVVIVAPAHREAAAFDATHPYTVIRTPKTQIVPVSSTSSGCANSSSAERDLELLQLGHPLPAGLLGPWLRRTARVPYVVFLGGAEITVPGAVPGVARLLQVGARRVVASVHGEPVHRRTGRAPLGRPGARRGLAPGARGRALCPARKPARARPRGLPWAWTPRRSSCASGVSWPARGRTC